MGKGETRMNEPPSVPEESGSSSFFSTDLFATLAVSAVYFLILFLLLFSYVLT